MIADNKSACLRDLAAGSSGELDLATLKAAEFQGTTNPHFLLTRLCFRLTKEECKWLIKDLLCRYPDLRENISTEESGVAR